MYPQISTTFEETLDLTEEIEFETDEEIPSDQSGRRSHRIRPSRSYIRNAKAMAATLADVKEYPDSYVFIIDLPGCKSDDIKVQVMNENLLVITAKRKREEEKEGVQYVKIERRAGKFLKKFVLPEDANKEAISAKTEDGVLTVTAQKTAPPESKKPRTIEVKVT
ncbi:hypothetical protein AQUCO_07600128v1 [Aquilegia coerulea]|uniref:SHSP domain-containing protein n=1 Tax=Aquilegia coerulea TaxID=218851 RepID=A0A2G5C8Z8_AQUCA|nr:hypothetical protein AQUCO_07600128v1 [Aquilegia coerulea]